MRLLKKTLLPLALLLNTSVVCAADGAWATYAPPSNDFDVQMPGEVQPSTKESQGIQVRIFRSTDGKHYFVVTCTTVPADKHSFRGFTVGIRESLKAQQGEVLSEGKASGSGWEGEIFNSKIKGNDVAYLAAHPAEPIPLGYTLLTNSSSADPLTKRFFDSFKVHVQHKAGDDATYGGLVDLKYSVPAFTPYELGRQIGHVVGFALPILLAVAVAAFVRIRLRRKKS